MRVAAKMRQCLDGWMQLQHAATATPVNLVCHHPPAAHAMRKVALPKRHVLTSHLPSPCINQRQLLATCAGVPWSRQCCCCLLGLWCMS